jgi:hypothetical protein
MIACIQCGRHHLPADEHCPHCSHSARARTLTTGAIILGLALASSACESNDKAVALYGAPYYPDTGDTGDTGEDPEDDKP